MEGTYGFVYSSFNGLGIGVFTICRGIVEGYDSGGCKYRGTLTINSAANFLIKFDQVLRGESIFVQSADEPMGFASNWSRELTLPPGFADGTPHTIEMAPGAVTVIFRKLPDEFAPYASGFEFVTK